MFSPEKIEGKCKRKKIRRKNEMKEKVTQTEENNFF